VAPQSGAKQNFYCTVYSTTLLSKTSKNLKKIVEDRAGSQK
jgi:hypothetical protein